MKTKLIGLVLAIALVSCTPGRQVPRPVFEYPVDGQTLDLELAYLFKVSPVDGADSYKWEFYQNGALVWENQRDEGTLSPSDYGIHPGTPGHDRFVAGDVRVEVYARIGDGWSEPAVITIHLRPLSDSNVSSAPSIATVTKSSGLSYTSSPITPVQTETPYPSPTPLPPLEAGQPVKMSALYMMDTKSGWGIESGGHLLRTVDGGSTWQDVTPPPNVGLPYGKLNPDGFFALDANHAWVAVITPDGYIANSLYPQKAAIVFTKDGGATWQMGQPFNQGPVGYFSIVTLQFTDENNGWFYYVYDHFMSHDWYLIYRTNDGGNTWALIQDSTGGPFAFSSAGIAFVDAQRGWFAESCVLGPCSPSTDWFLMKTSDAGRHWDEDVLPPPPNPPVETTAKFPWCGVSSLKALPPETVDVVFSCVVIDKSSFQMDANGSLRYHYHSADAGETWTIWQQTGDVQFITPKVGWQIYSPDPNSLSQLQKTINAGQTWTMVQKVAWPAAQFDFVDEQTGWAIVTGPDNGYALVHTQDGGKTWIDVKATVVP